MRNYPPAVAAHLAARKPLFMQSLLWLEPRDRTTNAVAPVGFWTGPDHETITIGGSARTYHGAGNLLGVAPVSERKGLEVRRQTVSLSPLTSEAINAIRIYDLRLARAELHEWYFDPDTMTPLSAPVRTLRGNVMELNLPTPELGGDAACTLTLVTTAWALTRPLTLKRSQAALAARAPADRFRQYNELSGAIETVWGEKSGKVAGPTTPPASIRTRAVPTYAGA